MNKVQYPELKHGTFHSKLVGTSEKYIIESLEDWVKYQNHESFEVVKSIPTLLGNVIKAGLERGLVYLFTDIHPRSGFPTYQISTNT